MEGLVVAFLRKYPRDRLVLERKGVLRELVSLLMGMFSHYETRARKAHFYFITSSDEVDYNRFQVSN
jgi:hypothetical protein